jgi:hypothetical protein
VRVVNVLLVSEDESTVCVIGLVARDGSVVDRVSSLLSLSWNLALACSLLAILTSTRSSSLSGVGGSETT